MSKNELKAFPDGFVWGAGTSAWQIEGSVDADGRKESIWEEFSRRPTAVFDGSTGRVACDSYNRWSEDVALLSGVGAKAYRMSFAWPRIIPSGTGPVNEAGIAFYERALSELREAGVAPWPTLFHWDLPDALQARGGWENREIVDWFANYVEAVADRLGHLFDHTWVLNEPNYFGMLGFAWGTNAPGRTGELPFLRAAHHQNLAQARAVEILRERRPELRVGTVITFQLCRPLTDSPEDAEAAAKMDRSMNRTFLDPTLLGRYPEAVRRSLERHGVWQEGDDERIARPVDFLGLNHYGPFYCRAAGPVGYEISADDVPDAVSKTPAGTPDDPDDLLDVLTALRNEYDNPTVYISEIGCAEFVGADAEDDQARDARLADDFRADYLRRHFLRVHRAIADGTDCRGIFVWSIVDNLEWEYGRAVRFGLAHLNADTMERTPKRSYDWYRSVIAANGVRDGDDRVDGWDGSFLERAISEAGAA